MNILDVLKLPQKTWTPNNNGVQANIKSVTDAKKDNQFGWKQPVTIVDLTGYEANITFQTQYPESLLTAANVGQPATWRLKWYSSHGKSFIVGYPTTIAKPTQNAQQAPQNAPQSTNAPEKVDWDAKDLRNARMNALNNATAMLVACAEVSNNIATWLGIDKIKQTASEFVDYIYNGLGAEPPGYGSQRNPVPESDFNESMDDSPPPEDSDIPF